MNHEEFQKRVQALYQLVSEFEEMFPGRPFTPDGHMVGSIGECLVEDAYNLVLKSPSNKGFDALYKNNKKVEIKATQLKAVSFRSCPEHTIPEHIIIIKILKNGTFEEYYNGPGEIIWAAFTNRKMPSNGQYQISLNKVKKLYAKVPMSNRIPKKA